MNKRRVEQAVAKASAFLGSAQQSNGGFASFSSATKRPFRLDTTYQTTFSPALILAALNQTSDESLKPIRRKLATWLLAQKSPSWSFNYWAVDSPERKSLPYPDDLDDTFCALIALQGYDASLIDETCLGHMTRLLIATEAEVGGPYRTWLVPHDAPKVWQDVDLAVNSNIACFLAKVAEPLPNLIALIEQAITTQSYTSPYYPSAYPLFYYLARGYHGPKSAKLVRHILDRRRDAWWQTPLQTALAISALTELGRANDCKPAVNRLLDAQLSDGSWPAEAFCLDPSIQKRKHYSGSAALTTAFVLEALSRAAPKEKPALTKRSPHKETIRTIQTNIMNSAKQAFTTLRLDLRRQSLGTLEHTARNDADHEITLLPYFFNESLSTTVVKANNDCLVQLGLANLYGWIAYTIYDDFLDDEGKPKQLSTANVALRYSLRAFQNAVPDDTFQELVAQTFDTIDSANAWELAHCRLQTTDQTLTLGKLPTYRGELQLSERSLGHTLGPLGVLTRSGLRPNDPRCKLLQKALQHYLVARQLNDDLHDWEQDIRAGHMTCVTAAILRELELKPGVYQLTDLLPKMQRQFWRHTITSMCDLVLHHTECARQDAAACTLLVSTNIVTTLANKIESIAHATQSEQAGAERFLAAYQTSEAAKTAI